MASPWPPHNVPATSLTLKQGHVGDGALAFQPQESLQTTGPLESLNDCGRNQQGPPSGRGQAAHWEPISACAFTTCTGSQSLPALSLRALGANQQRLLLSAARLWGNGNKGHWTHHPEKKLGLLSAFMWSQMSASTELCSAAFHSWPPAASWGRRRVVRVPCFPPARDRPQSVAGLACAVPAVWLPVVSPAPDRVHCKSHG